MNLILLYAYYLPFEEVFLNVLPERLYAPARFGPEIVFFLLFLYTIGIRIYKTRRWKKTPIDIPLLILAVIWILSFSINQVPFKIAVLGIRPLVRYVMIFYIITQSLRSFPPEKFIRTILIAGTLQVLMGFLQLAAASKLPFLFHPGDVHFGGQVLRSNIQSFNGRRFISGTMVRYGIYANFIAFYIIFLTNTFHCSHGSRYFLKMCLLSAGMAALIISFSRKAWISLGIALLIIYYLKGKRIRLSIILWAGVTGLIFLFLIVGFVPKLGGEFTRNPLTRLLGMFSPDYILFSLERTRLYILTFVFFRLATGWFWLGLGPGMVGSAATGTTAGATALFAVDRLSLLDFFDERLRLITDVGFVAISGQLGIVALFMILLIFYYLYKAGRRMYRYHESPVMKKFGLAFTGMVIIMVIENILGFSLTYRVISYYFWFAAAITCSSGMYIKKQPLRQQQQSKTEVVNGVAG